MIYSKKRSFLWYFTSSGYLYNVRIKIIINRNDKLRAEQTILKSHLLKHKKHLQTLCLGHDAISSKIKLNYGWTFRKLCVINIISALHKENKLQLRCKNSKLFRLIPRKKDSEYHVPVFNLSTENINTTPLRYGLHHSFTNKNKNVKRNVAVELETLARFLDPHITTEKKNPSMNIYIQQQTLSKMYTVTWITLTNHLVT